MKRNFVLTVLLSLSAPSLAAENPKPLRVGIVGLGSSHFIDVWEKTQQEAKVRLKE